MISKKVLDLYLFIESFQPLTIHTFFLSDGKNCKTCDRILSILETKTSELEDAGIKTVRINDKKTAKSVFEF